MTVTPQERAAWRVQAIEETRANPGFHFESKKHEQRKILRLLDALESILAEKETLRRRLCGNICHGDDDACFFQGSDEFNPCPLATEEDIADFKYTYSEAMEDDE